MGCPLWQAAFTATAFQGAGIVCHCLRVMGKRLSPWQWQQAHVRRDAGAVRTGDTSGTTPIETTQSATELVELSFQVPCFRTPPTADLPNLPAANAYNDWLDYRDYNESRGMKAGEPPIFKQFLKDNYSIDEIIEMVEDSHDLWLNNYWWLLIDILEFH